MYRSTLVIFVLFATTAFLVPDSAEAQDGWRNVIPRGRLIKRLREDFNDGRPFIRNPFADPTPSPALRPPNAQPPRQPNLQPRLQPRRAGAAPSRANASPRPTPKPNTGSGAVGSGVRSFGDTPASKAKPTIKLRSTASGSGSGSRSGSGTRPPAITQGRGFGMSVATLEDSIIVNSVTPGGNAAAAGLQRGDVISKIGGAPLLSTDELDAITKSMDGGDRVEFEFSRRGKESKAFVQFGEQKPVELPDPQDLPTASSPANLSPTSPRRGEGLQSILEVPSSSRTNNGDLNLELPPLGLEPPRN